MPVSTLRARALLSGAVALSLAGVGAALTHDSDSAPQKVVRVAAHTPTTSQPTTTVAPTTTMPAPTTVVTAPPTTRKIVPKTTTTAPPTVDELLASGTRPTPNTVYNDCSYTRETVNTDANGTTLTLRFSVANFPNQGYTLSIYPQQKSGYKLASKTGQTNGGGASFATFQVPIDMLGEPMTVKTLLFHDAKTNCAPYVFTMPTGDTPTTA